MRKIKTTLLFTIIFLLIFSPFTLVQASEEENIDTFDVSPSSGRWQIDQDDSVTESISHGMLKLTDIGDNTNDIFKMTRNLRDIDIKTEFSFKYTCYGDTGSSDTVRFGIRSETASDDYMYFELLNLAPTLGDSYAGTTLKADTTGTFAGLSESNSDMTDLYNDTWYTVKFELNIPKAQFKFEIKYNNQSRVSKVGTGDFTAFAKRLTIWEQTSVDFEIFYRSRTTDVNSTLLIDYIKAPFAEHEWRQTTAPSDANWLFDSWDQCVVEDDVNDESIWRLNVPYLDSLTTTFSNNVSADSLVDNDMIRSIFRVYGVDWNDGDLHELLFVKLEKSEGAGGSIKYNRIQWGDGNGVIGTIPSTGSGMDHSLGQKVALTLSTKKDRSEVSVRLRAWLDKSDENTFLDASFNLTVSSYVDDPSQEFVLEVDNDLNFDGNIEYNFVVESFDWTSSNIWKDVIMPIIGGLIEWIAGIFITAFNIIGLFLAGLFGIVGDLIKQAIDALQPFLTLIQGAITSLQTVLGTAIAAVQTAIEGIASGVWGLFQTILDDILAAIGVIIEDLIDLMGDIITAVLDFLMTIFADLIDFGVGLFFAFYDLLGLPDVLAIINLFMNVLIDIVSNLPQLLIELAGWIYIGGILILLVFWFYAIFLGFAKEGFDPFAGFAEFIERMLKGPDIIIVGIGPFRLCVGLFIILPLTGFLIIAPTNAIFWIW